MYVKLMVRGLLRHQKSGKRLFVLFVLCSLAVLCFLTFRESFARRYRQLAIDVSTAHLQVMPSNSPKLSPDGNCTDHREAMVLLEVTPDFERFLGTLAGIEGRMLALETKAALFTLDGEPTGFTHALIGLDMRTASQTLPGIRAVEGAASQEWDPSSKEIPLARSVLEPSEIVKDNDRFLRDNFRPRSSEWENFKVSVVEEMPALFPGVRTAPADEVFLAGMNEALARSDLAELLPERVREKYDYRVDDAVVALQNASAAAVAAPELKGYLKVLRKRLLQSIYPAAITPVRDAISLGVSYTMAIPSARPATLGRPVVFPVKMASYVRSVPLFPGRYYVDARVLRERLGIPERQGTNLYLRLTSDAEIPRVKAAIEGWIAEHELPWVVKDEKETGKLYASTSMALGTIASVLIVLFVVTVVIFVINTVLLAVVKRRREIGTSIALGLSPGQNVAIMLGEMILLVVVAWLVGSAIGTALILFFHETGLPGVPFMPDNRLILDFQAAHLAVSFAILLAATGLASLLPLLRLVKAKPVDLLKEAA